MENIKKGIVILLIVFVVMFGVLFGMNSATQDLIAGNVENWALNEVRALNLFPAGTDFERVQAGGLPAGVTGVFRTKNNIGFIIYTSVSAYGPGPMTIATAIGTNGRIIDTRVLENSETPSFLKMVQNGQQPQFKGKDVSLEGVDTVGGATITSEAFLASVRIAFDAFERVRR